VPPRTRSGRLRCRSRAGRIQGSSGIAYDGRLLLVLLLVCGGRRTHSVRDHHDRVHSREQIAACFISIPHAKLQIARAKLTVGVPLEQDEGPIHITCMMGKGTEDEASIVGEPFDSVAREISEGRLSGGEPIEFLSAESANGHGGSQKQARYCERVLTLAPFRRLVCMGADAHTAIAFFGCRGVYFAHVAFEAIGYDAG